MKKVTRISLLTIVLVIMSATSVFAGDTKIMEIQNNGANPVIFVKGIEGEVESATAMAGNIECANVTAATLSKENIPIDTLIIIDNSLSIPEKSRQQVKDVIGEILASRSPNERFCISTFGERVDNPGNFTDDYSSLKETLNSIQFQNRDTYLTDALYELLADKSFSESEDGAFRRILVVSDGVDNKSLGYTADELTILLKKVGVPIYSLGVYNSKKSNSEQLKNMFAISRLTNAESFLFDELQSPLDVVNIMALDRNIVRFTIIPGKESRDGSVKTVKVDYKTAQEESSITVDSIRMPQEAKVEEVKEEPTPEPEKKEEKEEKKEKDDDEDEESFSPAQDGFQIPIVAIAGGVAILAIIIGLIVYLVKRKKGEEFVEHPDFTLGLSEGVSGETEILSNYGENDGGATVLLMNGSQGSYMLTLVDINSPSRTYSCALAGSVVIGRKTGEVNICIDYDQSVSGKHCVISERGGRFYLENLSRSNGTYVNNNKIMGESEISSGCIIKMGRVQMKVEIS